MATTGQKFESLSAAMEALKVPVERRALVTAIVDPGLERFTIPNGSSYIAVSSRADDGVQFYVNRSFVDRYLEPKTYERTHIGGEPAGVVETFHDKPASGGTVKYHADQPAPVCPKHNMALPKSGVCDDCA